MFRDLLAGRRDYGWLEKRYVRKDGKVIWTLLSTATVRDAQGSPSTWSHRSRTSPSARRPRPAWPKERPSIAASLRRPSTA